MNVKTLACKRTTQDVLFLVENCLNEYFFKVKRRKRADDGVFLD